MDTKVRIMVDEENISERWWAAAQGAARRLAPRAALPLLDPGGDYAIIVDAATADRIRAWASALPGWDDGPEHARTPLIFQGE